MARHCSEADWRVFREVSERAIDRFCKRALDDIARLVADTSKPEMQRLAGVADLSRRRRAELDRTYLDLRRSAVVLQLCAMQADGLLEAGEFARFSAELRKRVAGLAEI